MTIVNHILRQMPAVSQPQRQFLDTLFATILALPGHVNFRNLSRYCDYSERTIARQFRADFDWPDFHQRVLEAARDPRAELISAQDASFIPKSGKRTFRLGHFFNGCAGRGGPSAGWRSRPSPWWMSRVGALSGTLEEADHVHLYMAVVWHRRLKRRLRLVVLVNRKQADTPRYIVLASTDTELAGRKLVQCYVARFRIEFLFRDGKQFTGLADCQARSEAALAFHFNASLATLNLARAAQVRACAEPTPRVFSMASWKQRHFNERLLDVFIEKLALEPSWVKNHPAYDELRTYGATAA